jgi:hypothetical protein
MTTDSVFRVLKEAKELAQRYRKLTGKPLGITGEVGEYEAARLLGVELAPARQAGYDATENRDGQLRRLQIKTSALSQLNFGMKGLKRYPQSPTQSAFSIPILSCDKALDAC